MTTKSITVELESKRVVRVENPIDSSQFFVLRGSMESVRLARSFIQKCGDDLALGLSSREEIATRLSNLTSDCQFRFHNMWTEFVQKRSILIIDKYTNLGKIHFASLWMLDFRELNSAIMSRWVNEKRMAGISESALKELWKLICSSYRYAIREQYLSEYPWKRWTPRFPGEIEKKHAVRNLDEFVAVYAAALDDDESRRLSGIFSDQSRRIAIMAMHNLGLEELAALAWEDVDEENQIVHVRRRMRGGWKTINPEWERPTEPPKYGPRRVRMHGEAVCIFQSQRAELQQRGKYASQGPVFPGIHDVVWLQRPESVLSAPRLQAYARDAGLPPDNWTPVSLRRVFPLLDAAGDAFRLPKPSKPSNGPSLKKVKKTTGLTPMLSVEAMQESESKTG